MIFLFQKRPLLLKEDGKRNFVVTALLLSIRPVGRRREDHQRRCRPTTLPGRLLSLRPVSMQRPVGDQSKNFCFSGRVINELKGGTHFIFRPPPLFLLLSAFILFGAVVVVVVVVVRVGKRRAVRLLLRQKKRGENNQETYESSQRRR